MKKTIIVVIVEIIVLAIISYFAVNAINYAFAESGAYYVICDPDSHVNARNKPQKAASIVGRLECGDMVWTDGKELNGYTHIIDCSFEQTEAWIKTRYMIRQKPIPVSMETVVMKNRTLARNGVNGSVIRRIKAGSAVKIIIYTPEWCFTNKGYIKTECLGVNR